MSISGLAGYGQDHIRPGRIWSRPTTAWLEMAQTCPYLARPDMEFHIRPGRIWTCPYPAKLSQLAGGAGKKHLFWRVFASFSSCFLLFHGPFVCTKPFLQKKSVHLTFSSRRSAHYKVPPHIGGCHFLLCQHTNTKDIAGQSAR